MSQDFLEDKGFKPNICSVAAMFREDYALAKSEAGKGYFT